MDQAYEVLEMVESAYREGTAVHEVERGLFQKLLEMGYQALGYLFELYRACDEGERVDLSDGGMVKRLAQRHGRAYQSVFGAYELERWVYGSRAGQKLEYIYIPLDVRLQLPQSKFSYLLQDWDQSLAVETPYAEVNSILQRILGLSVSVQSLERTNRSLAHSVESYWDSQVEVAPAQGEQLVVGTADGKGVVIRKSAEEKAVDESHEQASPKPACLESKAQKKSWNRCFGLRRKRARKIRANRAPSRCPNTSARVCIAMRPIRCNRLGKRFAVGWPKSIANAIPLESIGRFCSWMEKRSSGKWAKSYSSMRLSLRSWTCSMPARTRVSGRRLPDCLRGHRGRLPPRGSRPHGRDRNALGDGRCAIDAKLLS